jgi:hypothetical protein
MKTSGKGGDTRAQAAANGKKVGRPAKEKVVLPVLAKQLAIDLYQDKKTRERWEKLRDASDESLRFQVEREIQNQATGKAVQPVEVGQKGPLKINVNIRRVGA